MLTDLTFKSLGIVNYHETLQAMKHHIKQENFKNEIWLLEHPPIFTLGTAADKSHIINSKNIPIVHSDRGGEVTYHGPGQLVVYFLLNIRERDLGPKKFVKQLEDFVQSILEKFEIKSTTIEGSPGVYVESKKIASIGLRFSKGFSYHGISINVDMDLQPFQSINPCGYQGLEVTQIKDFYSNISLEKVKLVVQNQINKSFS